MTVDQRVYDLAASIVTDEQPPLPGDVILNVQRVARAIQGAVEDELEMLREVPIA